MRAPALVRRRRLLPLLAGALSCHLASGCGPDAAEDEVVVARGEADPSEDGAVVQDAPARLPSLEVEGAPGALSLERLDVRVTVAGRLARTEVTQVFRNALDRQAEGTYEMAMPDAAVISRLAMDVDGTMVEGELAEKERAREIYESIVRTQKDPALLEWQGGNRFKMQVFPIPARGTKTIILEYEELLPLRGRATHYAFGLPSLPQGDDGARIGDFSFSLVAAHSGSPTVAAPYTGDAKVDATGVAFTAAKFTPRGTLRVRFPAPPPEQATALAGQHGDERQFFVDVAPVLPEAIDARPRDLVVAVDTSRGIGDREIERVVRVIDALADAHASARIITVTASLTARTCTEPPAACLRDVRAAGATHLEAMLAHAAQAATTFERSAIVLFTDGVASVGELDGEVLTGAFERALAGSDHRVITVAVGHEPDSDFLAKLAARGRGHSVRMSPGADVDATAKVVSVLIRTPVVRDVTARAEGFDVSLVDAPPRNLRAGEPLPVLGRSGTAPFEVTVSGTYEGRSVKRTVRIDPMALPTDKLVTHFWARAQVDALERGGSPRADIVATSLRYGVMSRATSFLVLENEEMFKRFGVDRLRNDARIAERNAETAASATTHNLAKGKEALQELLNKDGADPREPIAQPDEPPPPAPAADSPAAWPTARESAASASSGGAALQPMDVGLPPVGERALGAQLQALSLDAEPRAAGASVRASALHGRASADSGIQQVADSTYSLPHVDRAKRASRDAPNLVALPEATRPRVVPGSPMTSGAIDREVVLRRIKEVKPAVERCYARALLRRPQLGGRVDVRFVITATGAVGSVDVLARPAAGDAFVSCVSPLFQRMRFPATRGDDITVKFPFILEPPFPALTADEEIAALRRDVKSAPAGSRDRLSALAALHDALVGADRVAQADIVWSELMRGATGRADHAEVVLEALPSRIACDHRAVQCAQAVREIVLANPGDRRVHDGRFSALAPAALRDALRDAAHKKAPDAEHLRALWYVGRVLEGAVATAADLREICARSDAPVRACIELLADDPSPAGKEMTVALRPRLLEVVVRARAQDLLDLTLLHEEVSLRTALGDDDGARLVLSELVELAPHDIERRRMYAFALQERGLLVEACEAHGHVASFDPSRRELFRTMMRLRVGASASVDLTALEDCIVDGVSRLPVQRDLSLVLTWDDPSADLDLHVTTPSGEEVYFRHREGADGGLLYYDVTDGFGPEIYTLGQAERGTYTVEVVYYRGDAEDVRGTLTILEHAGTAAEVRRSVPFEIDEADYNDADTLARVRL